MVTGSSFTSNRNVATSFNCGGVVFRASTFTRNAAVYQSGSYNFGFDEFTGNKFTSNGDVIDALPVLLFVTTSSSATRWRSTPKPTRCSAER